MRTIRRLASIALGVVIIAVGVAATTTPDGTVTGSQLMATAVGTYLTVITTRLVSE